MVWSPNGGTDMETKSLCALAGMVLSSAVLAGCESARPLIVINRSAGSANSAPLCAYTPVYQTQPQMQIAAKTEGAAAVVPVKAETLTVTPIEVTSSLQMVSG